MKNKWTRLLLIGIAMFSLTLSACGGGGGGGGGSESLASMSYTGERSQVYLNAENAETLILGAYEGLDSENIVPLALETSATNEIGIEDPYHLKTLMTRTLLLAQTNNQISMLNVFEPWEFCNNYPEGYTTDTIKETNTGLQGDINFFNCNAGDGSDVIIVEGKMTLSLVEEGNLIKVSMTMNPLYMVSGVDRYALYGKIDGTINVNDMTSIILTTDITMEETSGRTYWLNNYKMDSVEKYDVTGTHWGTELTISGRYYSNDHGYVDFASEEVIFMPFYDLAPAYDGLIKFTGSNGSHAYLWLGQNQDDYCIKVFNDSGVVDIGTCAPWNGGGDTGGDTVTEKGQLAINETHNLQIGAYATDRYSFIPSVTGTYTIAITNAQSDLSWMLSRSTNWDDEEIYFCDNFLTAASEICTPDEILIAGQEYYLFIDEWDNVSGSYTLRISPTQTGVDTVTSLTGRVWMDKNLGATRVATAYNDSAAYGDLYQWGRGTDGHEKRTSSITTTLSFSDTPGHASFIVAPDSPYDWLSPQNDSLWQGEANVNNPCPSGFRLPTIAEWEAERVTWASNDRAGAFASPLKLVSAGDRSVVGGIYFPGGSGGYWSSSVTVFGTHILDFGSFHAYESPNARASGKSVRCIAD